MFINCTEELKDDLVNRISIREVCEKLGIKLFNSGSSMKISCPNKRGHKHGDIHPSCSVIEQKHFLHCHSCGWNGDIFALVMTVMNVSFPEAVGICAEWAGYSLQELQQDSRNNPVAKIKNLPVSDEILDLIGLKKTVSAISYQGANGEYTGNDDNYEVYSTEKLYDLYESDKGLFWTIIKGKAMEKKKVMEDGFIFFAKVPGIFKNLEFSREENRFLRALLPEIPITREDKDGDKYNFTLFTNGDVFIIYNIYIGMYKKVYRFLESLNSIKDFDLQEFEKIEK